MVTNKTTVDELLIIACKTTEQLKSGEYFIVRDLFKVVEWRRITLANRRLLGKHFYNYTKQIENSSKFFLLKETPEGQQRYKIR